MTTMRRTGLVVGAATLLLASAACERRDRKEAQPSAKGTAEQIDEQKSRAERALEKADQAKHRADEARQKAEQAAESAKKRAEEAEHAVGKAEHAAGKAEHAAGRAGEEAGKAIEHEVRPGEQAAKPEEQAAKPEEPTGAAAPPTEQDRAETERERLAREQEGAPATAQTEQMATGKLTEASESLLVIERSGQAPLRLRVDPQTSVVVDGNPTPIVEVPKGTEVRVTYETVDGQPVALRVEDTGRQPVGGETQ